MLIFVTIRHKLNVSGFYCEIKATNLLSFTLMRTPVRADLGSGILRAALQA